MRLFKVLVICVMVLGLVFTMNLSLDAQGQSKEEQEKMKKWQAHMTPGANHKYLEYFVGSWTANIKMRMEPGAPMQETKNESKYKMILGGRFLKTHVKGSMMGMPMEGLSITGYDNFKKKFESFWIDNSGTGFYLASGTLDKSSKIRTDTGVWDDVMSGGKMKVKMVTKIVDGNKFLFDMYMEHKGKMFKSMEMIFTRKK